MLGSFESRSLLAAAALLVPVMSARADGPAFHTWAEQPVMGWNSWDFYGTTVTEAQTKAQADYMAANLKSHGWDLITVDIQWYAPNPAGDGNYYNYDTPNNQLVMDGYCRLQPATTRFPSAAGGQGFTALANYVHGLGLKFGIHIMRGIPRNAVVLDLPILGTSYSAQDIADTGSTCPWNPDMYGVDMSKPGAQAYYDSLFAMYAAWGVDFVKVDDISRPYDAVQQAEIEAIREAIDKTGRPMVLSLSPGQTPPGKGIHVMNHANQWRISDDFWDYWGALYDQFERLHNWTPYRGPGHFPDADMLPLGKITASGGDLDGRATNFTQSEQYTLMTLWSIARSPLIHGGDMTQMDAFTLGLFTNDEVIAVNQSSTHNCQRVRNGDSVVWVANDELSADRFLAVFNTGASSASVTVDLADLGYPGSVGIRSLWDATDLGGFSGTFSPAVAPHGAGLYRLSSATVLPTPWITGAIADSSGVVVSWEEIPSATSYTLKRATAEAGPFEVVADGITGMSFLDDTVEERTSYHYVVSAEQSGQEGPDSNPWSIVAYASLLVTNGGFETNAPGGDTGDIPDWFDANPGDFWTACWLKNGGDSPNGTVVTAMSAEAATATPNGGGTNAYVYQEIGTSDGASGVTISFQWGTFAGAPVRDMGITAGIYESDGSFVPADNTDVLGGAGVALVEEVSILRTNVPGGTLYTETITFDLSGTDSSAPLFLRFNNYEAPGMNEAWVSLDNVSIDSTMVDFANWISGFTGVGGVTGFAKDPDHDGISSGLENFFDTDPSESSQGISEVTRTGANTFTFQHPRNPVPASDIAAAYRWSLDLTAWNPDGGSQAGTTVDFSASPDVPTAGTTTVTATITGTVPAEIFADIEVIRTDP